LLDATLRRPLAFTIALLQRALRERFPTAPIVVMTLAGGWRPGYLPTANTYGKGIYQESIANLAAGCLESLIEAASKQIDEWLNELA
jgi:hypothetical protein